MWPFCYWVCVILDHFSRRIVGFALFKKPPSSLEVTDAIDAATVRTGRKPTYITNDKGTQFYPSRAKPANRGKHHYSIWAKARGIAIRFGAVGKYGSTCPSKPWRSRIAIIERFMRTLKDEGTRKILVPYTSDKMRNELGAIITWYNEYRPHMTLKARTPKEVYDDVPLTPITAVLPRSHAPPMKLTVSFFTGRKHLPIFYLNRAA